MTNQDSKVGGYSHERDKRVKEYMKNVHDPIDDVIHCLIWKRATAGDAEHFGERLFATTVSDEH